MMKQAFDGVKGQGHGEMGVRISYASTIPFSVARGYLFGIKRVVGLISGQKG